jgi:hypothetical protein
MMQILGLSGLYFDAAVVFVTSHSLLFSFALAILSVVLSHQYLTNVLTES